MSDAIDPLHVAFDYLKSNQFRVAHVDGVIGGITPSGFIHFAVFSERPSIPRHVVNQVTKDGKVGPEIPSLMENRGSIVRELEVDLIMSSQVAVLLRDWLNGQIDALEELKGKVDKESAQ